MKRASLFALFVAACLFLQLPSEAAGPRVHRASVRTDGNEISSSSGAWLDDLSDDGRVSVWEADSPFVVADTNGVRDVYVHFKRSGRTWLVSRSSEGVVGNGVSQGEVVSGNGRFVAFQSAADNLVPNDGNGNPDAFIHDLESRTTTRISLDNEDVEGEGDVYENLSISSSGRFTVFATSSQLVPADVNALTDVYVHDRSSGERSLVSIKTNGNPVLDGSSSYPFVSGDGRFIAFMSNSEALVANDTNESADIFLHDRVTGRTRRLSVNSNEIQKNGNSRFVALSYDGQLAVFDSVARLDPRDNNNFSDMYLRNLNSGKTTLISLGRNGGDANGESRDPVISPNGRMIGFQSTATNIIRNDPPGPTSAYLFDRKRGQMLMVDRKNSGAQGNGSTSYVSGLSRNGSVVQITTNSALVTTDSNGVFDVYTRGPLY